MEYNFDQKMDRENTSSVKWGLTKEIFGADDVLPMWVADMDFQPPIGVKKAIQERVDHGIYGYTFSPPSTSEAIQQWLDRRHGWDITPSWILYSTGVVPSISVAIEALTSPEDKVMLQSPVYTPFYEMIKKNNRKLVNCPLQLIENRYEINFTEFENKLKSGVKLFLLCNPHNPSGRIWSKEELIRIGELCYQYNCLILSDEIHSDIIFKPYKHTPIASLDERFKEIVLTCIAPSKTFNLAGLQASAVIIPNEKHRESFKKVQERQGFFALSTLGTIGMEAAYRSGEIWLEGLLAYLDENIQIVKEYIDAHIPGISVMEPEGSYLIWLNCRSLHLSDKEIKDRLLKKGKLALEPGNKYGQEGEGFVRMNIACPKELVLEGLERLKRAFV
ncbi:MalY/PatB family protein [Cytobacillus sp. FJAT-53684]|uniref:cysteine-S-conjugate beta-lyase n=1 Tax=Cytobacillus mangrovibacter TaxID=3299024 RepID=A0ABW6K065_9BACI